MRVPTGPFLIAASLAIAVQGAATAGEAHVDGAKVRNTGDAFRFTVTVSHGDEGWHHYADAFRVVGPDGTVYGTRELAHPHVNEQPFTRALDNVVIPDHVTTVIIQAHDKIHGWGGHDLEVELPR